MPHAFAARERTKQASEAMYQRRGSRASVMRTYASTVATQKTPDSTSLRSDAHATDSTRSGWIAKKSAPTAAAVLSAGRRAAETGANARRRSATRRSEEHTSELQSLRHLVCR